MLLEHSQYCALILAVGVGDIRPLNQNSRILVQPPKEKKTQRSFPKTLSLKEKSWAKNSSRKPPEEQWPWEHWNMWLCNTNHARTAGGFSSSLSSRNKAVGTSRFIIPFPSYAIGETTTLFHKYSSLGEPWSWNLWLLLKAETFYQQHIFGWVHESNSLNYYWTAHQWLSPWAGFPKVWDSLLEVKTIFPAQGRETLSPQHILSDWNLLN